MRQLLTAGQVQVDVTVLVSAMADLVEGFAALMDVCVSLCTCG
jgi:hypothetical protein